jgi:hypothetical protein
LQATVNKFAVLIGLWVAVVAVSSLVRVLYSISTFYRIYCTFWVVRVIYIICNTPFPCYKIMIHSQPIHTSLLLPRSPILLQRFPSASLSLCYTALPICGLCRFFAPLVQQVWAPLSILTQHLSLPSIALLVLPSLQVC